MIYHARFFRNHARYFRNHSLEFYAHFGIELPAGEIVGHGVLMACDVGDPIVGVDVAYAEEVEAVEAEPHVAENALAVAVGVVEEAVAHADVDAAVGGSTEIAALKLAVGG